MTGRIHSTKHVREFFRELVYHHDLNLHPDTDFSDYITPAGVALYTRRESDRLNSTMEECFLVCESEGEDIYSICHDVVTGYLLAK